MLSLRFCKALVCNRTLLQQNCAIIRPFTSFLTKYNGLVSASGSLQVQQTNSPFNQIGNFENRRYLRKKTKTPFTKPLYITRRPGETDETFVEPLDLSKPKLGFEDIPELQEADEVVKKIFSLEMADGQELKKKRMENIISQVQEHPADLKSIEVQIAELTVHIRHMMRHMLMFRKDKKNKIVLFHRMQKRGSLIEKLRRKDYEKFEWLLKELKIKYTPYDNSKKLSKREVREKAARDKFEAVKAEKLAAFREELAKERLLFNELKEKEFTLLEKELKDLGITSEITSLPQTINALNLGEPYVIKPPVRLSRRKQVLAKKFELYGKNIELLTKYKKS